MCRDSWNDICETIQWYKMLQDIQLYGLCGGYSPTMSCMKNKFWKIWYPDKYVYRTKISDDGYPIYRQKLPSNGWNNFKIYRGKFHIFIQTKMLFHTINIYSTNINNILTLNTAAV